LLVYEFKNVIDALYGFPANEAADPESDLSVGIYEEVVANEAVTATDAVPNSDPVIPFVTVSELRFAVLPDSMIFFQFGILY
jgi:hypothetical protein